MKIIKDASVRFVVPPCFV